MKILRTLLTIICLLSLSSGKGQIDTTRLGIPGRPVGKIKLTPIRKYPALLVRHDDFERLRRNFEALPADAPARRNRMVRAWFSSNEQDREKATREFVSYWKTYTDRWTPERLDTQRPDGVSLRGIWRCVQLYDIVNSFGYLTQQQRTEFRDALVRAVELALGSDPDHLRTIGTENLGWRMSNIWADVALSAGWVGMAFPELPQAERWVRFATNELLWMTENGTWDGAWHECARYHLYQMKITINYLIALRNRTGIDLFDHPDVLAQGRWCIDFATPRDRVAGLAANDPAGVVLSWGTGDSTWGENMGVINLLAGNVGKHNPQLAGDLMWLWRRSGFHCSEEPVSDLLIDEQIAASPNVTLRSQLAPKKGYVVMRDGHDTPDEVWMAFKCGDVSLCGHEHGDANSFSLMAFGAPLALDAGSGDYGDPNHRAWNKRSVSHNVVAFRRTGETDPLKYNSSSWVDGQVLCWQTNDEVDYLAADASKANGVEQYVRHVVFVKPGYFVIRDQIRATKESSWLLHSPCDSISWHEQVATLHTPLQTQLDVHVLKPAAPLKTAVHRGQIGAWTNRVNDTRSWYTFKTQQYIEVRGDAGQEYITVLQPRKAGIEPLRATLSADGTSVLVNIGARCDRITFTTDGVRIDKGGHIVEYKTEKQ